MAAILTNFQSDMSTTRTATLQASAPARPSSTEPIILRLRLPEPQVEQAAPAPRGVTWEEGVVDNEHMKKRKSKKCCIFHKQRPFDESDSEDDDDDEGGWEIDENGLPVWKASEGHSEGGGCCHSHHD